MQVVQKWHRPGFFITTGTRLPHQINDLRSDYPRMRSRQPTHLTITTINRPRKTDLDFDADELINEEPDSTAYHGDGFGRDGVGRGVGMVRQQGLPYIR